MKIMVPVKVHSPNVQEHYMAKGKRIKRQRAIMYLMLLQNQSKLPPFPVSVKFTYYGKRRLDSDNCCSSMKLLRDEIAKFYGVNDGDLRWQWPMPPEQVTGKKIDYAVGVEIESIKE